MPGKRLTRHFILLRALRWLPVGLVLPFLVLTPVARGLELGAVGAVFAIHSAVLIALEVPSGALAGQPRTKTGPARVRRPDGREPRRVRGRAERSGVYGVGGRARSGPGAHLRRPRGVVRRLAASA
jgi:hypothetical protein